jgi:Flp pilus assembly protein TadG
LIDSGRKKKEGFAMKWVNEKGAAVVEFAVILPLLLLLIFGMIEFGFLIYNKAMITNASREAARNGILFRNDRTGLKTEISNTVDAYLLDFLVTFGGTGVHTIDTVPDDAGSITTGDYLTVTVAYPYEFLVIPAFISNLAGGVSLVGTTTMRAE